MSSVLVTSWLICTWNALLHGVARFLFCVPALPVTLISTPSSASGVENWPVLTIANLLRVLIGALFWSTELKSFWYFFCTVFTTFVATFTLLYVSYLTHTHKRSSGPLKYASRDKKDLSAALSKDHSFRLGSRIELGKKHPPSNIKNPFAFVGAFNFPLVGIFFFHRTEPITFRHKFSDTNPQQSRDWGKRNQRKVFYHPERYRNPVGVLFPYFFCSTGSLRYVASFPFFLLGKSVTSEGYRKTCISELQTKVLHLLCLLMRDLYFLSRPTTKKSQGKWLYRGKKSNRHFSRKS